MHADTSFDISYGYWFNLTCERFYKRIDLLCNFVQLVGGSGAALAAINDQPQLVVASGIALAVVAALSLLVQPAVKAEQHMQAKCRYLALKARDGLDSDDKLNADLAEAQRTGPAGIHALAVPAFNAALDATGFTTGHRPLGWAERLASALA